MVVKVKEYYEKTRHVKNNDKSEKTFYEEKEIQDVMGKYYQIKRDLIILHSCKFAILFS